MRIHFVALFAAAALLLLASPRSAGGRASLQGIPLGDLVRAKRASDSSAARPSVPTERNPSLTQLTPGLGGTSATGSSMPAMGTSGGAESTLGTPGATTGAPQTSMTGSTNLTNAGLPATTPYSPTVGGSPTTSGNSSTVGGVGSSVPPTPGAAINPTPGNP